MQSIRVLPSMCRDSPIGYCGTGRTGWASTTAQGCAVATNKPYVCADNEKAVATGRRGVGRGDMPDMPMSEMRGLITNVCVVAYITYRMLTEWGV